MKSFLDELAAARDAEQRFIQSSAELTSSKLIDLQSEALNLMTATHKDWLSDFEKSGAANLQVFKDLLNERASQIEGSVKSLAPIEKRVRLLVWLVVVSVLGSLISSLVSIMALVW